MKARTVFAGLWVVVAGWMLLGCAGESDTDKTDVPNAAASAGNSFAGVNGTNGCPAGYAAVPTSGSSDTDDTPSLPAPVQCVPTGNSENGTGPGMDDTSGQAGGATGGGAGDSTDQGGGTGGSGPGIGTGGAPDDTGSNPSGTPDGGIADGGIPDGGTPDGGIPDGGIADGGIPDGGTPDGGIPDGGIPDGGIPDGGTPGGGTPDGGAVCQSFTLDLTGETIGPNVMLAVDVSNSMNDPINAQSNRAKIEDTKLAINALLNQWESKVRFGWMQFPASGTCTPGSVRTECGGNTAPALRTTLSLIRPSGGTPTGESLSSLLRSVSLHDNTRSNFVVLLTDGVPTCPFGNGRPQANGQPYPSDEELAVKAVSDLRTNEIDTFVIGIGQNLNNTSPAVLNRMAVEGGRARAGLTSYYQVNNMDQLGTALGSVMGIAVSCNHILPVAPAAPDKIQVLFDGQPVSRDILHQNGFDYDATRNQLTFYGKTCDSLQNAQVKNAQVKINC